MPKSQTRVLQDALSYLFLSFRLPKFIRLYTAPYPPMADPAHIALHDMVMARFDNFCPPEF